MSREAKKELAMRTPLTPKNDNKPTIVKSKRLNSVGKGSVATSLSTFYLPLVNSKEENAFDSGQCILRIIYVMN